MPRPNVQLIALYQKQARNYDRSGVRGLDTWRREAVRQLHLKRGNLVVDSGCGTSLNFPWLQEAVGPQGNILGGDLNGITAELIRRCPWQRVWSTMRQSLVEVKVQPFWMGFFYLARGEQPVSLLDGARVCALCR